jgi:4-hydroxybenzoate polyprenyltransferase
VRSHRASGGETHLVSAANQSIVTAVADHLGIFDSATGSDSERNLKGAAKIEFIAKRFGAMFQYAGDSVSDLAIWKRASESIVVKRTGRTIAAVRRAGIKPSLVIERPCGRLKDWRKALRLHQWSKNLIIFVPLMLSHQFLAPGQTFRAIAAFLLFSAIASGTYVINDLADLSADRGHAKKRHRPFCAGRIEITHAAIVAGLLVAGGLAAAATFALHLFETLLCYTVLTLCYSFFLKRELLIDVACIGLLFLLRVTAGMVVIDQPLSLWLCSFTAMLFTSLATAKRHAEVIRAAETNKPLAGRGYLPQDAPLTVAVGTATAACCILLMLLYMHFEAAATKLYANPIWLFVIPIVVASWVLRIWGRAHRGTLHDDPVVFALKDRVSWLHAVVVGGLWLAAVVGVS